jgi:hypothetical protein
MTKKLPSSFLLLTVFCIARKWGQNPEGQIGAAQYGVYQITGSSDETSTTGFTNALSPGYKLFTFR